MAGRQAHHEDATEFGHAADFMPLLQGIGIASLAVPDIIMPPDFSFGRGDGAGHGREHRGAEISSHQQHGK